MCRSCMCARGKAHYKKNPQRYLDKARLYRSSIREAIVQAKAKPCSDCGHEFPAYVMDFDHLGDKAFSLSDAPRMGVGPERLLEEIAKCEVVCANCHRLRTHQREVA